MKGINKTEFAKSRPLISPLDAIDFCLEKLYDDKTHEIRSEFVTGLSFEELIGALILARDELSRK